MALQDAAATPGYAYDHFDAPSINAAGEVLFWSRLVASAPNDECSGALDIGLGSFVFSTQGATSSPDQLQCITPRDVWFRYTAPQPTTVFASIRATSFAARMLLYRGSCAQLVFTSCDTTSVPLAQGQTLFIRIGSTQSAPNPPIRGYGTAILTLSTTDALTTRGFPLDSALFLHADATTSLLTRSADLFQAKPPLFHAGLELPAWSDAGLFAFSGPYMSSLPTAAPAHALFRCTPGAPATMVDAEDPPQPPAPPSRFLVPPTLDAAGRIAYTHLDGFHLVIGERTLDAGQLAPQTPGGSAFVRFSQPVVSFPAVAFHAEIAGKGVDDSNNTGLWVDPSGDSPDASTLVARTGDAPPGVHTLAHFVSLSTQPAINASAVTAFHARIAGDAIDASNNSGIWTTRAGPLSLLARAADPAPGIDGASFASLSPRVQMNARADTAFTGTLAAKGVDASNNSAIWLFPIDAEPRIIAREGQQVPGLPPGVVYASLADPVLNDRADVAFTAVVRGDKVSYANSSVLMLAPYNASPEIVARTADTFEVAPNDSRVLSEISFGSSPLGAGRASMNNRSQLVFTATFTDGSTAILAADRVCPADFNHDDFLDSQDLFDFLAAFFETAPGADFNHDASLNSQDFFDFLAAFFTGC